MGKLRVFISYASEDRLFKDQLVDQLHGLKDWKKIFAVIVDTDMRAGEAWEKWIESSLHTADIGVFLLSPRYLQSTYCIREAKALCSRKQSQATRVIPILLESCDWRKKGIFKPLNIKSYAKPIAGTENPGERWFEWANEIHGQGKELLKLRVHAPNPHTPVPAPVLQGVSAARPLPAPPSGSHRTRLATAINTGGFTPILGPGCNGLLQSGHRALIHIRRTYDTLLNALETEDEKEYARSVVASNLPKALDEEPTGDVYPPTPWAPLLLSLQTSLVRLGLFMCRLFAHGILRRTQAIANSPGFSVSLQTAPSEERVELENCLLDATNRASALFENQEVQDISLDIGLGAKGIRDQLILLAWGIFQESLRSQAPTDISQQWLRRYKGKVPSAAAALNDGNPWTASVISLSQLDWLGNLLWHTIRFQAPMSPRLDDLAFQLALCLQDVTPPRRESVGAVAAMADLSTLIALTKEWLPTSPEADHLDNLGFYEAIAKALHRGDDRKLQGNARDSKERSRRRDSVRRITRPWPLVLTTNLDGELQSVFHSRRWPHQVLMPVYIAHSGVEQGPAAGWLIRKISWNELSIESEWIELGDSDLSLCVNRDWPLIVKLHGSPLDDLPDGPARDKVINGHQKEVQNHSYQHRMTLSDVDFLEGVIEHRSQSWPPDLAHMLHRDSRMLYFFGFPVADPFSRLRLYGHIMGGDIERDRDGALERTYLVDHPEDPVHRHFLKHLKITFFDDDALQLAEVIHDMCGPF